MTCGPIKRANSLVLRARERAFFVSVTSPPSSGSKCKSPVDSRSFHRPGVGAVCSDRWGPTGLVYARVAVSRVSPGLSAHSRVNLHTGAAVRPMRKLDRGPADVSVARRG
jgi:hypothetical protein